MYYYYNYYTGSYETSAESRHLFIGWRGPDLEDEIFLLNEISVVTSHGAFAYLFVDGYMYQTAVWVYFNSSHTSRYAKP